MRVAPLEISGCFEFSPDVFTDKRGDFVKTFHAETFVSLGLNTEWPEEYFSVSSRNVLRGMHFQIPPYDHSKLVCCIRGQAIDVLLDLRLGSPTFGRNSKLNLSRYSGVYIAPGVAHGFLSLEDDTVLLYRVSKAYNAEHDAGILWNSFGVSWPIDNPLVSERDSRFPRFGEFKSPFQYEKL